MDAMQSLQGLSGFLTYLLAALAAEAIFITIYTHVTPYSEMKLIRAGNAAAASSLGGALVGFTLPLASAVAHSVSFVDFAIWAAIALVVQVVAYFIVAAALGGMARRIVDGDIAAGVALGIASLCVGILNAACMTY
jgi:putative membrane protein